MTACAFENTAGFTQARIVIDDLARVLPRILRPADDIPPIPPPARRPLPESPHGLDNLPNGYEGICASPEVRCPHEKD